MSPNNIAHQEYRKSTSDGEAIFEPIPGTQITAREKAKEFYNQHAASRGKQDSIQYEDYPEDVQSNLNTESWYKGIKDSFTNSHWRAATSIGRANVSKDAEGNTIINDTYDWNHGKAIKELSTMDTLNSLMNAIKHPTQLGNFIGNYMAPDNTGTSRQVRINLGKR